MLTQTAPDYTNRLIHEKSPYLLQHAHNPVDWFPWGKEALEKAQREEKMIFVSIGYATCHWCHVMEKESFENTMIAALLNGNFICIKVDREERPDLDRIYMEALQSLQQSGGWPLNMFLTPQGKPFSGGTYFPLENKYGRSSFPHVLQNIIKYWETEKSEIYSTADKITEYIRQKSNVTAEPDTQVDPSCELNTFDSLAEAFDEKHGGFLLQEQNKFPSNLCLQFLLRYYHQTGEPKALEMVEKTLREMLAGGIYDQIGGGISRYSTDQKWLIPHFEKMLYDNALLVWSLVELFQITGEELYQQAAEDILNYLERDMLSPEGHFYSAEDADTEGVEGKYYVWSKQEIMANLGPELGRIACKFWGVSNEGNFENGLNVLHQSLPLDELALQEKCSLEEIQKKLTQIRQRLWRVRLERERPLCDDKVLTSWNALAISAFARASRVFYRPRYEKIAIKAAEFLFSNLFDESDRLLRRYRKGQAKIPAFLNDYSQLAVACLDLYEATYELKWFRRATELMDQVNHLFQQEKGPYFDTGSDTEELLIHSSDGYDGVVPSGNSMAAIAFLKLDAYGCDGGHLENAQRILVSFEKHLKQIGLNFSAMLCAYHMQQSPSQQVIIMGLRGEEDTEELLAISRTRFYPNMVTVFVDKEHLEEVAALIPIVRGKSLVNDRGTAYLCINQSCQKPIHLAFELEDQLAASIDL
ncbi:MAG: thioredoxin domain-containing protein [SAR324 cluster bacterium]|uniref:Thioredoxin domain-containing protein n=1 Tax=SAR324 cluster bacterium TaxID=2024889 RepID=A0A2A4SQ13_9DELT|nr:MAG: thioredoxin domain-containing protein [SAR324 cluster bacterium]